MARAGFAVRGGGNVIRCVCNIFLLFKINCLNYNSGIRFVAWRLLIAALAKMAAQQKL